jgi:hypothetical protein
MRLLVIAGVVGAVLAAPFAVFYARAPVLVVTELPFAALYGESRLKKERASAAFALFRQVKPVVIADGVSPDMVIYAINEVSRRPLCVLFARSQAVAALRFHEQFPEIPTLVLSGLVSTPELPPPDGILCVYGTDRETDMYRAGLFAGIMGSARRNTASPTKKNEEKPPETPQTYVFWQDNFMPTEGRELFSRGIREKDPESNALFINFAEQMPDLKGIAGIILTGAGAEFLENNAPIPQILFGWLDPDIIPQEVIVQFDDSVWALTVPAVRMAMRRQAWGVIPSKPLIFSHKIADNNLFQGLKKTTKKVP